MTLLINTHPHTQPPIRTVKVFVTFKKADYKGKIQTSIFASKPHIKMERLSSGPSRALLSQFPSGDKQNCNWVVQRVT